MKKGFWNFKNGFTIDCSADSLNQVPVALAVLDEIARIRETSDLPIYVLGMEFHNNPLHVLVPYAFMQAARLRDTTSQAALMSRFELCLESPCNLFEYLSNDLLDLKIPPEQLARIAANDPGGGYQREAWKCLTPYHNAPHAEEILITYVMENQISLRTIDHPLENTPLFEGVLGACPDTGVVSVYDCSSKEGVAIRNEFMFNQLQRNGHSPNKQVIYYQGGATHLFGTAEAHPYKYSMAPKFQRVQEEGRGHVICLLPFGRGNISLDDIPAEAKDFSGTVFGLDGLDYFATRNFSDYAKANMSVARIFKTLLPESPIPHVPRMDRGTQSERIAAFMDAYVPSLLASVSPPPAQPAGMHPSDKSTSKFGQFLRRLVAF